MATGDIKLAYASSAAFTITIASLATDTNLLAGRQATVIDNTSNLYKDYYIGGFISTGTSPTSAKSIEVWCFGITEDSGPTYPDTLGATDANVTLTSTDIKNAGLRPIVSIPTDNTSNRKYPVADISVASLFGGIVPKKFGVYVVHNTGVNLHATAGNHGMYVTGVYETVA